MSQATVLIDGNNFYASCEQSLDPSLSRHPLIILSNNDGCIIARDSKARALGIPMGQPYFKIRYRLKDLGVEVRSSNYTLYGDMSKRLMNLLTPHCEQLEVYSIDEAFAHVSRPINGDLHPWARHLRKLIGQSLGLPIAIGIGANKTQAKLANYLAKSRPDHAGIFDLSKTETIDDWLEAVDIEEVWGVGHKLARWCRIHGVNTARQLRDMPSTKLRTKCGIKGIRLQYELRGESCLPLTIASARKKETCVSRTFGRPITDLEELSQAVATYVVLASKKLRRQDQLTSSITVFIRTSAYAPNFYSNSATTKLNIATNNTSVLLKEAMILTKQIFKPYSLLMKAGVIMQSLQGAEYLQQNLLVPSSKDEEERHIQLMKTIDHLNDQFGENTINWAACGLKKNWRIKSDQLSLCSTTRITEIPIVKA